LRLATSFTARTKAEWPMQACSAAPLPSACSASTTSFGVGHAERLERSLLARCVRARHVQGGCARLATTPCACTRAMGGRCTWWRSRPSSGRSWDRREPPALPRSGERQQQLPLCRMPAALWMPRSTQVFQVHAGAQVLRSQGATFTPCPLRGPRRAAAALAHERLRRVHQRKLRRCVYLYMSSTYARVWTGTSTAWKSAVRRTAGLTHCAAPSLSAR
jgi:hypothetical protein